MTIKTETEKPIGSVTDLEVSTCYQGNASWVQIRFDCFGEISTFKLKLADMKELVRQWERVKP